MVGSWCACLFDDHVVCKSDKSEISVVELGVLMLRVGGSARGWFNESVKEKNWNLVIRSMRSFICGSEPTRSPVATTSSTSVAMLAWSTCEGKLPVRTRRNVNSIRGSDENSGGASRGFLLLRPGLHLDPSVLPAINQSPKARANERGNIKAPP